MPDAGISNLLGDFIQLRVPLRAAARQVDAIPELDEPHVELLSRDVVNVLQKFLAEEIDSEALGLWADVLNERLEHGVRIPEPDSDLVSEVVQQLAMLHGLGDDITTAQAAEYLRRLSEAAT
jgi:hypothetical protein